MPSNKEVTLTQLQLIALRFPAKKWSAPKPVDLIAGEEWKLVTGYLYVSNLGRVKKMCYNKKGQFIEHLYKTQVYNGHLYAQYTETIERKYRKIARIVLMAFNPLKDYAGKFALHLDCNPLNCQLINLQWASLKEIHKHQKENGFGHGKKKKTTLIPIIRSNGKKGYQRVNITTRQVAEIKKFFAAGISQSKIAELTGIRQSQIKNIVNGKIRKDL